MLREDWMEQYLKQYDPDTEIPHVFSVLYDEVQKLADLFCNTLCKCFLCDGDCDKDILIDTFHNYEIIGVVPKDIPVKEDHIIRIDLGWCRECSPLEFWNYFKEEVLPFHKDI